MTQREKQIYEILRENPMISQNEIAEKMGITRSSVSVHINNLVNKGIILGRGYVLSDGERLMTIGAANLDMFGTVPRRQIEKASLSRNPINEFESNVTFQYGGVAKNIADYAVRMGIGTSMVSVFGRDVIGKGILDECSQHNISTDLSIILDNQSSSMYFEMLDESMKKGVTVSSVSIERRINVPYLESIRKSISTFSYLIADDGLEKEALRYLATGIDSGTEVYLFAFADNRIDKYSEFMNSFAGVIFTPRSAIAAAGVSAIHLRNDGFQDSEIIFVARTLIGRGVKELVIPYNTDRICYANNEGVWIGARPIQGDYGSERGKREAISAGLVYAKMFHFSTEDLLAYLLTLQDMAQRVTGIINSSVTPETLQMEKEANQGIMNIRRYDLGNK